MKTADENANVLDVDFFQKAYKKLKSSAYYDKTNLCLRDRIARAESETDIDDTLKKLCDALQSDSWDNYEEGILSNIRCIHLPKKIAEESPASSDSDKKQEPLFLIAGMREKFVLTKMGFRRLSTCLSKGIFLALYGSCSSAGN